MYSHALVKFKGREYLIPIPEVEETETSVEIEGISCTWYPCIFGSPEQQSYILESVEFFRLSYFNLERLEFFEALHLEDFREQRIRHKYKSWKTQRLQDRPSFKIVGPHRRMKH